MDVTRTLRPERAKEVRKKSWRPPARLDTPEPPPGVKYRWVRHELRGEDHTSNVYGRTRQGYEPVRPDELGEFDVEVMPNDGKHSGVVRSGDLILMKTTEEVATERNEFYAGQANQMEAGINAELRKNAQGSPIVNESDSTTSIGGARVSKKSSIIED